MTKGDWMDLTVLERKKYNYLSEVMDISRQMGDALDRNDQVSMRMLIAMRQDPILGLEEIKQAITSKRDSLLPEDRERVSALDGGAPPRQDGENFYAEQITTVRRVLERVVELDRTLSRRLAGGSSFYAKEK